MHPRRNVLATSALAALALFAGACSERATEPHEHTQGQPLVAAAPGATLVECPTDVTLKASATIDLTGGSLSVGGTTVNIPAGAVLLPTLFELVVPASQYMEISVTGGGQPHFEFEKPVTVTIDYSRCSRSNIEKAPLSVFYIDEVTKALLQDMGGTDDKAARKITFGTDHLSGYAIAN